ncbi:MAG: helicase-associated domain-containing protein [Blastocatellia bacterium]
MARRQQEEPGIPTVRDALDTRNVDDLKKLLSLLPTAEKPTRKGELVDLIERHMTGESLPALWEKLDDLQRKAVAETIHSDSPVFNAERFKAKYGAIPVFGTKKDGWGYAEAPTPLRLFFYSDNRYSAYASAILPDDLRGRLLAFVPEPEPIKLDALDESPEFVERVEKDYEFDDEEQGVTVISGGRAYAMRKPKSVKDVVHRIPLVRRDTERAAQQDLSALLRLIDKGKVSVSDKTFHPSSATMQELGSLLRDGDFYVPQTKKDKWEQEAGPIKAFAWPMLAQAGKLAELHGKKLALTKAGRNALAAPPAETLKLIWQRWLKSKSLDEFSRVCAIKGQQGKGKRGMTATEDRRAVIVEALRQCPVGKWVRFDDFSRFMQAATYYFDVTRDPWDLYIVDAQYGSLGHAGYHDWNILQARYLLAFLFEYAATLGLIDVAYIDPADARDDYTDMWGAEDLGFLSQYDGLIYFRLNPLGAYYLDLADKYTPEEIEASVSLAALPSLQINVTGGELSPDETLLLETYAEKESDKVWRLSRERALAAVESGNQIKELREFLQARDEQPLPETVEGFIVTTDRQARALKNTGAALLIECADAELAELIANHERTKKLCLRAGERHLVIKVDAEEQFRKAVHLLGYGMPRV